MLVSGLPESRYQVRYVKVTGLSKRDLCKEIAAACGLSPTGIYPALVRKLQEAFEHTAGIDGLRPVIVLDEAHDLRPESLAMMRLLTNFEMDSRLVVSLVLAGQPPLKTILGRPEQAAPRRDALLRRAPLHARRCCNRPLRPPSPRDALRAQPRQPARHRPPRAEVPAAGSRHGRFGSLLR